VTKVLVIGAGGKLGTAIVTTALARGWEVTGIVRDRTKAGHLPAAVKIVEGDGRDAKVLQQAVPGHDAVVVPAGGRVSPVSSDVIRALLPVMKSAGVGRLIAISAYGTAGERGFYPWVMRTAAKAVVTDKAEMERLIRESQGIEWTIVRPGVLNDKAAEGYRAGENLALSGFPQMSRADVAGFVADEISGNRYVNTVAAVAKA
jgi:uncharacterized protein YbjT (DUF2867 family)